MRFGISSYSFMICCHDLVVTFCDVCEGGSNYFVSCGLLYAHGMHKCIIGVCVGFYTVEVEWLDTPVHVFY